MVPVGLLLVKKTEANKKKKLINSRAGLLAVQKDEFYPTYSTVSWGGFQHFAETVLKPFG